MHKELSQKSGQRARALTKLHFQLMATERFSIFVRIGSAFLTLFSTYFLTKLVDGKSVSSLEAFNGDYLSFALIGYIFSFVMAVAINNQSLWIRRLQLTGTLEAVLSTRLRLWELLLYSAIQPALLCFMYLFVYIGGAVILFDVPITPTTASLLILVCVSTLVAFSAFGIIGAASVVAFRKNNPFLGPFTAASMLLSGVLYPVEVLPEPMQWLAQTLPLTHALEGARQVVLNASPLSAALPPILSLGLLGVLLLPLSLVLFRYAVRQSKKNGLLGSQ